MIKLINQKADQAPLYKRLIDIYQGQLKKYVLDELQRELSPESFKIASRRVAPINVFARLIDKLSVVYKESPLRTHENTRTETMVADYAESMNLDSKMQSAEILLNTFQHFALEPYINSGTINVRVLAPHEFCVLSDDEQDPTRPTHLIKYMGNVNIGGKNKRRYQVFSSEKIEEVDEDGTVLSYIDNPFGGLPFVYVNNEHFSLQPQPDEDTYQLSMLAPKLLTDLNYATQFQSHSIMYGIDLDVNNLKGSPDSFWSINSREGDSARPQIGVLSPQVDTDKVIALINFQIQNWLESRGIRPGSIGQATNHPSGISKLVDEADVQAVVSANRQALIKAESDLWLLVGKLHNLYQPSGLIDSPFLFPEPLKVSVQFSEQAVIPDPAQEREQIKFELDNKLTTKRRALMKLNPVMADAEIDQLLAEIEEESINKMKQYGLTPINNQEEK